MFAVLLASDDQLQIGPLAAAFASFRKVPAIDAAHEAKGCWGIAGENMPEDAANGLITCLAKAGLKAVKIPQSTFHLITSTVELNHAVVADGGFSGIDDKGTQAGIVWEDIQVIGVASLKSFTSKTVTEKQGPSPAQKIASVGIMLATGLPISIGPKKKTVTTTTTQSELSLVLDLITHDERRIRLFADHIDYSSLKDRKTYNVMGNFKIVVGDCVAKKPQARMNKGTRVLLSNQPLSQAGHESLADLERECRWIYFRPQN